MSPIGKFNHDKILKILSTTNYERNNNLQPTLNIPQMPFSLPDLRQDIYKKSIQDNLLQNTYKYTGNNGESPDNKITDFLPQYLYLSCSRHNITVEIVTFFYIKERQTFSGYADNVW